MNVIVTVSRGKEATYMKTFTIDNDNNISVFASKKEAAAASATPFDPFTSAGELAELAAEWPMSRLIEVWNSIPGVTAVTKFTNKKIATERIWKAIENLGANAPKTAAEVEPEVIVPTPTIAQPELTIVEVEPPQEIVMEAAHEQVVTEQYALPAETDAAAGEPVADAGVPVDDVAPKPKETTTKPTPTKKQPKAKKAAAPESSGPREGSKTARVVAMLQRDGGATLSEIMEKMVWQKHTVRGFMAGAMKKAGYTVESFKPEGGERSYRIIK